MGYRLRLPSDPRFLVGARFVCSKCRTRGVTPSCACGARTSCVDVTDSAGAKLFAELTAPPASEGAPTREELFWGGLKSPLQWVLSGAVAIAVGVMTGWTETAWGFQKVGYALLEVLLLTLLFRLPMLAAALMFRVLVTLIELVVTAGCFIGGKLARSYRLQAAAGVWLVRAEQTLSGDYFWRRSMVELRGPPAPPEVLYQGALPPSAATDVLIARGSHGAFVLRDAEVPDLRVVLATGETITVAIEVGVLSLAEGTTLEPCEIAASSPLFREMQRASIAGSSAVVLQGGEWSESDQGAGYRAPLERRTLRGTLARPLHVEIV